MIKCESNATWARIVVIKPHPITPAPLQRSEASAAWDLSPKLLCRWQRASNSHIFLFFNLFQTGWDVWSIAVNFTSSYACLWSLPVALCACIDSCSILCALHNKSRKYQNSRVEKRIQSDSNNLLKHMFRKQQQRPSLKLWDTSRHKSIKQKFGFHKKYENKSGAKANNSRES